MEDETAQEGFSDLFPFLPILSFASFICCMFVLPALVKTRILALCFCASWIAFGNLIIVINTCIWRNSIRDIPIYADFVALIWSLFYMVLNFGSLLFLRFVWVLTGANPSRDIFDKRTRYNRQDLYLLIGAPLLWMPISILARRGRYAIIENIGPVLASRHSVESTIVGAGPTVLTTIASFRYAILTIVNLWRAHKTGGMPGVNEPGHSQLRPSWATDKFSRYCFISAFIFLSMAYQFSMAMRCFIPSNETTDPPWYTRFDIRDNMQQLRLVHTMTRYHERYSLFVKYYRETLFAIPTYGFIYFFCFGPGSDALLTCWNWCQSHLLPRGTRLFDWFGRPTSRIVSFIRVQMPMDPGNFVPFLAGDIVLDPYPLNNFTIPTASSPNQRLDPPPIPRSTLAMKPSLPTGNNNHPASSPASRAVIARDSKSHRINPPFGPSTPALASTSRRPKAENMQSDARPLDMWRSFRKGPIPLESAPPARTCVASDQPQLGNRERRKAPHPASIPIPATSMSTRVMAGDRGEPPPYRPSDSRIAEVDDGPSSSIV